MHCLNLSEDLHKKTRGLLDNTRGLLDNTNGLLDDTRRFLDKTRGSSDDRGVLTPQKRVLQHALTCWSVVSMLPTVGEDSTMKLSSPVSMVDTDQAGFHVSGWKSLMDRHSL